jgi:sarcosine oxidase subunit gamma
MLEAKPLALAPSGAVGLATPRHIFSITAFAGTKPSLEAVLGHALPPPGRMRAHDGMTWLWSGQNSWLAMSETPCGDRLAAAAPNAALTEQSDGRAIFLVSGPHSRKILQKLVPIDLHELEFLSDHTSLTLAGHIPIQIWREDENFALACFRSFAPALHHALLESETPGRS